MALVSEETRQKIKEGVDHVRIHLETLRVFGDRLFPIQRDLTHSGMAAVLPSQALKQRAENILKHHGLIGPHQSLPVSTQRSPTDCVIASATGIQVNSYEGIMDLKFLTAWERTILSEFVQRFDLGQYPELSRPPVTSSRIHNTD